MTASPSPGTGSSSHKIGRVAATLMTVAMIVGTGIFGALGATADKAGSSRGVAAMLLQSQKHGTPRAIVEYG